jgi:hypothetical protein
LYFGIRFDVKTVIDALILLFKLDLGITVAENMLVHNFDVEIIFDLYQGCDVFLYLHSGARYGVPE